MRTRARRLVTLSLALAPLFLTAPGERAAVLAAIAAPAPRSEPEAAVRAVLDAQVAAWNRGDLDGYMAGYAQSPELTFYAGGTVTLGWQPTLERYRRRYKGEGRAMGTLSFPEIHIERLGDQAALARGRWHLLFPDGKQSQGLFTVLLKKGRDGFRIVHDHSSSE
jgi:beta-aspartyl-peptidase (threonine type)